jgi:methyl-galactoside transport system permease protein
MNLSSIRSKLINNSIYIVLLILMIVIVAMNPSFLSIKNLGLIISQSSTRIIFACALAGIIVLGGTDLAAGRIIGFAGLVAASLLQDLNYSERVFKNLPQLPLVLPLLVAIIVAVFFSYIHGLLVAKRHVAPFIASLGMQLVVFGLMSVFFDLASNSAPIGVLDERYTRFAQGSLTLLGLRIPYLIIYASVVVVIVWFIWNKTKLGRNMFAIGGNPVAANVSGVNIVGTMYGFGGTLEAGRTGSATNALGQGYELDAIAACVVGGVSMRGGIGTIRGIVTGVLLFQLISYGLVYIQVNPYLVYFIKGLIILIAVVIDIERVRQKK